MKFNRLLVPLLVVLSFGSLNAQIIVAKDDSAKPTPAAEAVSLFTMSAPVDEARVHFTVTDKNGKFIKALTADDFHLLDNVNPPERVLRFQAHSDAPMRVVMLFDIS